MKREQFDLAPLHKDFDMQLYKTVMKQDKNLVKSYATKESRKLYEQHTNVAKGIHFAECFTRFNYSKHGILHTKIKLEHNIIDYILRFFHNRFPLFIIAIETNKKTHVIDKNRIIKIYNQDIRTTIAKLESSLPVDPFFKNLEIEEDLWNTYYDSQYIPQRRNLKLMDKMMPKKYRNDIAEENIAKRCHSLKEFI